MAMRTRCPHTRRLSDWIDSASSQTRFDAPHQRNLGKPAMNINTTNDFFGCLINPELMDEVQPSEAEKEIREFLSIISPISFGRKLIRIGKAGDGSYLLPDDLDGVVACYSPGVNNFKDFEDCLVNRYGIESHMCDASSDAESFRTAMIQGKQTFKKLWLDVTESSDSISLASWISETTPDETGDLILQMDIEGAEYRNFLDIDDSVLMKFRIIVIEFHGLDKISDSAIRRQVILPVFRKLNKIFQVVHAHPNNFDGDFKIPSTEIYLSSFLELTLHRRDRISPQPHNASGSTLIPHPQDIVNIRSRPPIFLDCGLLISKRSWRSKLKMLNDWSFYLTRVAARGVRDCVRGRRSN